MQRRFGDVLRTVLQFFHSHKKAGLLFCCLCVCVCVSPTEATISSWTRLATVLFSLFLASKMYFVPGRGRRGAAGVARRARRDGRGATGAARLPRHFSCGLRRVLADERVHW